MAYSERELLARIVQCEARNQIVDWALSGNRLNEIGEHCFYHPTSTYAQT